MSLSSAFDTCASCPGVVDNAWFDEHWTLHLQTKNQNIFEPLKVVFSSCLVAKDLFLTFFCWLKPQSGKNQDGWDIISKHALPSNVFVAPSPQGDFKAKKSYNA